MTKTDMLRQHILRGEPITGLMAIDLYRVYRLSSVVNKMRNEGHDIQTIPVQSGKARYAKYVLPINRRK